MKTDDLIERLAADLRPASPVAVPLRLGAAAAAGAAAALAAVLLWLGLRPDLAEAVGGMMFWMKAGYAAALGAAGFWCAERLARPAGSPRGGVLVGLVALGLLTALGLFRMFQVPRGEWMALWLGGSWSQCPIKILSLALPTLALALLVMRQLAPTHLRLAGAAAGCYAGGVAAAAYGLHCPETAPIFVATWYSLGVALSGAAGALVGPWLLRWR